ncbi:MAG TPA: SAM-dependent methyltransferase [Pseudonocardiaceae bacterium]
MTASQEQPPVDVSRPNAARMYDYMLGGSLNFAVDREAADAMLAAAGSSMAPARLNRSFLRRAVQYMADDGIDQFLDLGSGIPTVGNVHEIAYAANPASRVVYVDVEPVAVAHARHLLADNDNAAILHADLRDVDGVLNHPDTRRLIDFSRPVGLLLMAILHFIPEADDPAGVVAAYRAATMRPGSYLALSHFSLNDNALAGRGAAHYERTATPVVGRTRDEILAYFDGLELVPPGLVWTSQWRPDGADPIPRSPQDARIYAALGRMP